MEWIGETPGIDAVTCPVIVSQRRDLARVQVARDHALAGVQCVGASGALPALEAVLDHGVVVDKDGPASGPRREMVLQVEAIHAGVFGGNGSQPRLETSVVIS